MIQVAAVILTASGHVLACRRASHKSLAGKWEFPGGKIEHSESAEQAAVREIKEELGLELAEVELKSFHETSVGHDNSKINIQFFTAYLNSHTDLNSTDHDKLLWLSLDGLRELDWAEADVSAVEKIIREGINSD